MSAFMARANNFWVARPESSKGVTAYLLALSLATILGCQKDEISHYQVPRLEIPPQEKQAGAPVPLRMLTAIFPQKDRTWFFKLTGPPEEVEKHKGEFEHFIQSVRFTKKGDPPVTWTAPEGWHREAGAALRFASFRFGAVENPLELTVTPLGREAQTISACHRAPFGPGEYFEISAHLQPAGNRSQVRQGVDVQRLGPIASPPGQHEVGTLGRELARDRLPDPGRRSGDDGDFPVQTFV